MDAVLARLEDAERRDDVAAVVAELRAHGGSPAHAPVALLRACAVLRALSLPTALGDNRAKAAAAGAIAALLHTLRAHCADAAIVAQALWAWFYVLDVNSIAEANRLGAVNAVIATLRAHGASADVQAAGFSALGLMLRFCLENRIAACRAGAFDAALAALRIHKANAFVVLVVLSVCHLLADERSRATIEKRADIIVPSVVAVMRLHGSNVDVQARSCQVLSYVLLGSLHDKQTHAGAAGAVEALVRALLAFPADARIQGNGLVALRCLVEGGHEANAIKAGACGAMEAVMALLRSPGTDPDLNLLTIACEVLARLNGDLAERLAYEQNLLRAVDAGAFDAVVAMIRSNCEDAGLATYGCVALSSMLITALSSMLITWCPEAAGGDLAVDTAALVMRAHAQNADVQEAALAFLGYLLVCIMTVSVPDRRLAWQGHEVALAAVLAAMQSHIASLDVSAECALALSFMLCLGDESVQVKAAALGAFDVIVATMQAHASDYCVQVRTCSALEQLVAGSTARTRDAGTAGAVEAVVSALSLHCEHAEVQQQGFGTLLALIAADEGNAQRAFRAGALRLKFRVRSAASELMRCRNAVMRELERAAAAAAVAAAAELLASEELERGAAAAALKPGKRKKKRGGGAGGASGSGGGQTLATREDAVAAAAHEQPPPQAADADGDAGDAAATSQLSALAARRRRRTATKAARRRGASTGGAEATEAAGEEPAPDAQEPAEAPEAAAEDAEDDADDAAAVPPAAQMQQLPIQPPAAAPPPAQDVAESVDVTCVICLDAPPRSVMLLPCRHLALCGAPACAAVLGAPRRCPLCRVVVVDTLAGVFF